MLKLLERNIASAEKHLVLLAPPHIVTPEPLRNVTTDAVRHRRLVRDEAPCETAAPPGTFGLLDGGVSC